jgi:threonine dehydrogenase-like Zn-dependent dehydrogenase
MKAVVLQAPGQVDLLDMPIPAIRSDQMLIRTGAATVCTSDLNDIRSNPFGIALPVVIGHEGAGTVAQAGQDVRGFQVGDRVATHPVHPCGACQACHDGASHLCLEMEHFGINLPGTMAEYYLVRQDRARLIPASVDFALATLAEPVSVCLEALAQARLAPGQRLLVVGDGPFGVLIARLAKQIDLSARVIAGFSDFRLSYARGAAVVNTAQSPDPVRAMLAACDGAGYDDAGYDDAGYDDAGYDAVIIAAGSPRAFADGLKCLKPKGRLVVFASIHGETPVDLFEVQFKELEIIGSCNDQERFDEAVSTLSDPDLALSELVTHRLPLEAFAQGLHLAEFGLDEALKVSLVFPEPP